MKKRELVIYKKWLQVKCRCAKSAKTIWKHTNGNGVRKRETATIANMKRLSARFAFFTLHFVSGFLSFQINVLTQSYTLLRAISSSFAYAFFSSSFFLSFIHSFLHKRPAIRRHSTTEEKFVGAGRSSTASLSLKKFFTPSKYS